MTKLTATIATIALMLFSLPALADHGDGVITDTIGDCAIEERSARGDCPGDKPSSAPPGYMPVETEEGWEYAEDPDWPEEEPVEPTETTTTTVAPQVAPQPQAEAPQTPAPAPAPQPEPAPVDIEIEPRGYAPAGVYVI